MPGDQDPLSDSEGEESKVERHTSRPGGLITKNQREYLLGFSDVEPRSDAERRLRERIRRRVINGILDFNILELHLDDRDRRQIATAFNGDVLYDPDTNIQMYGSRIEHLTALSHLFAFCYRETSRPDFHPQFADSLEKGVEMGKHNPDISPCLRDSYKVAFGVEQVQQEQVKHNALIKRLEEEELQLISDAELKHLMSYVLPNIGKETGELFLAQFMRHRRKEDFTDGVYPDSPVDPDDLSEFVENILAVQEGENRPPSLRSDRFGYSPSAPSRPDAEEDSDDLESVTGIGPSYAHRLHSVGLQSVASLALADPEKVADALSISEERIRRWIERANKMVNTES